MLTQFKLRLAKLNEKSCFYMDNSTWRGPQAQYPFATAVFLNCDLIVLNRIEGSPSTGCYGHLLPRTGNNGNSISRKPGEPRLFLSISARGSVKKKKVLIIRPTFLIKFSQAHLSRGDLSNSEIIHKLKLQLVVKQTKKETG